MSLLVIDIGNTRLKWGWFDSNGLLIGDPVVHKGADVEPYLEEKWTFAVAPRKVVISCVANDDVLIRVINWLQEHWQINAERFVSPEQHGGLRNAYEDPERLGSDRWLAMFEAYQMLKTTVCVVDCGSAITIDAIDSQGQHLGGLILPGFNAMRSSLGQNTNLLVDSVDASANFQLANSTQKAIAMGTSYAISSLVMKTISWLEQETSDAVQCIITGGDAEKLSAILEYKHIVDKDLVIKGLVRTAGEI